MKNSLNAAYSNVGILTFLSLLQGLQLLIIACAVSAFIPFSTTDFVTKIFPVYLPEVRPEREMLLFRFFVIACATIMAAWVIRYKQRLEDTSLFKEILGYVFFSGICVFVQIFFVFKLFVWGAPLWAKVMLYVSIIAAIFAHIFWPEVRKFLETCLAKIVTAAVSKLSWLYDAGFIVLLGIFLYPCNLDNVLGRMLVQDQFYHVDSMLMAPGFAHLNGLVLQRDVTSEYSVGLPVVISQLLQALGHFDYAGAVVFVILVSILYYIGLYCFIGHWLGSRGLAVFGVLLAVKLQMFHWGVAPLVWQFPSATALRHWPDVVFLFLWWRYIQTQDMRWLLAAGACVGIALFWMMDIGIYLLMAFCVGIGLMRWQLIAGIVPFALAIGFLLLAGVQPQAVWDVNFWRHQGEFAALFLQGWGALPMTEGLKDKQFFAFVMGFIIPVIYVLGMLYSGGRYWRDRQRTDFLFVVVLSVYGLGVYHYFIHRSGVTSYYAVCIPFVLSICFWASRCVQQLKPQFGRLLVLGCAGMMVPVLMTSYMFTYYPNVLNISGFNWSVESTYYQQHFDFSDDAALIASLTGPKERVPIISSFETRILMQAQRPPFFYYSPLVESSLMEDPKARLTYLHTHKRVKVTLDQLAQQKPAYVFIEQKMLAQSGQTALTMLKTYILKHYVPLKTGVYLVAYKRIGA